MLRRQADSGFTLVEIVMVVAILALMSAMAITGVNKGSTSTELQANVNEIVSLFESARSQAVKMNQTVCVQVMSYPIETDEGNFCVSEVWVIYPKKNNYQTSDCMEPQGDYENFVADYKTYKGIHMKQVGQKKQGCFSTDYRNVMFKGGSGYLSTGRQGGGWREIGEQGLIFSNPYVPSAGEWRFKVERSGVISAVADDGDLK